jgi:predicted dehydrogenase
MAKRKVIRVGIIGQGRSGYDIHAAHLRGDRRYEIAAVVDPLKDRREQAREEFGADVYATHKGLLPRDDLDLVVNASPSHRHVPITLDLLKAGHNVLCEKPLARRVADVDKMRRAAKRSGKLLAVFQQARFAPYFEQLRKVIDSGVLGRIVMIRIVWSDFGRRWDWQTLQERDGGSLLNTGPHAVDHALQLFGPGKPQVVSYLDRTVTFGNAEDHAKVILSGKGKPTIDLEVSSCTAYSPYNYCVYGTQGGLMATMKDVQWRYFSPKRAPKQELTREPLAGRVFCREKLPWNEKSWTIPKAKANVFPYMARQFYSHLYKTLTEGAPLVVTVDDIRRQVAIIEECHRQNPIPRRRK